MADPTTAFDERARALAPDFRLDREIGRGGMGVVYLAHDVTLDRTVAIKMLLEETPTAGVRARFLNEARTAAKLSHPNIVPIYRAEERGGLVFFVMAYVDGRSLAAEANANDAAPSSLEVSRILRDVALALDHAHRAGIVHRDITRENIMIERATGRPLITDFGIARVEGTPRVTQVGEVLGTFQYVSPERIKNEAIDGRADLYSLGVVGFHLLAGRFPLDSDVGTAVLIAHVSTPAPNVATLAPGVDPALAAVIDRCLAKEPGARFATAADLAAQLSAIIARLEGAGPLVQPAPRIPRVLTRREGRDVLARAAQLQDQSGDPRTTPGQSPLARPAAIRDPADRDPPGDDPSDDRRTLTSGHAYDHVRSAAEEVGIPRSFVDQAAAEILKAAPPRREPMGREGVPVDHAPAASRWVGSPPAIAWETHIARATGPDDFEGLARLVERRLGDPGHLETTRHTMSWSGSADQRPVFISIASRDGHTTIRAEEQLATFGDQLFQRALWAGGASIALAIWLGPVTLGSYAGVLGFWLGSIGASYLGARLWFRKVRGARDRELKALTVEVAGRIGGG
ncbi:MAG TPA: serine/threonine-protein kinase [Gemmatimonadaceae bacterium]|nr:serine/threonine-protein kinase [Gemmatimonadaceae bacterium]